MDNKTYDSIEQRYIETPEELTNFFNEIEAVCKKYNLSISHEDTHGGFEIKRYNLENIQWLKNASKDYK